MMKFSAFGDRFQTDAGILSLMDDLGKAMASRRGQLLLLGGGNPAHIPAVEQAFRRQMEHILATPGEFERIVGCYTSQQGDHRFIAALAGLFQREFGWPVGPENIALTNGSQSAFFYLFNLFGGRRSDGSFGKILLPLAPEYIGYGDVGLEDHLFTSRRPQIEFLGDGLFKYHVDFEHLNVSDDIAALCVSRPTNPTGNVLTDDEVDKLSAIARERQIPFIIDNAYGTPFPNIIFTAAQPRWESHIVLSMSLSKLGLPGLRTGIVIAAPEVIAALSGLNAICNLAPGSMAAALATDMVADGDIIRLSRDVIRPYYENKSRRAVARLQELLRGLDCFIHKSEGAIFLWLWMRDLPITSAELYERLKRRGVIVVAGHYFFPGLPDDGWRHRQECLRITFAQDDAIVDRGLEIIAEEVRHAYRQ